MKMTTICAAALIWLAAALAAQDSVLVRVQRQIERQEARRTSAMFSYYTDNLITELDNKGRARKVDTVRTWQKVRGDSVLADSLLYTSRKEKRKGGGHRESAEFPKLGDPRYEFTVQPPSGDGSPGRIAFKPRKPRSGDLAGELFYDPASYDLIEAEITMPKPKFPAKEFLMKLSWTTVDGVRLPSSLWMQASWSMVVMSGRFRVESMMHGHRVYP
jgi:hypothetical protein